MDSWHRSSANLILSSMSEPREQRHRLEGNQNHRVARAQNVKPKPGRGSSQQEHPKRARPARVRRSRSTDSQRGGRGRWPERERHHDGRRPRGRSEEPRRERGEGNRNRVQQPQDELEDTECAICFCAYDNVYRTPKLLACGHTFCLECLARINVSSLELKTLSCPVCREVTQLPHGQDLPRLGNNQNIIGQLPPDMQRALSIRFKRSKGKLLLKNPPPNSPTKPPLALTLPVKSAEGPVTAAGGNLNTIEQGGVPPSMVDVGRPPNRVRGRLRRLFRSDQCYYAVVGSIITVTVVVMLVGILAFVIIPNVAVFGGRPENQSQTQDELDATPTLTSP